MFTGRSSAARAVSDGTGGGPHVAAASDFCLDACTRAGQTLRAAALREARESRRIAWVRYAP
eukprot:2817986-Pleurochrysis_carterae.AAC.2